MNRVSRTECRRNVGETADFFFHPSRPSGLGYLIPRKSLICRVELACEAGRMPFHPGNPGYICSEDRGNPAVAKPGASSPGVRRMAAIGRLDDMPSRRSPR